MTHAAARFTPKHAQTDVHVRFMFPICASSPLWHFTAHSDQKKKETAKAHKNTANMSDGFNNAHV